MSEQKLSARQRVILVNGAIALGLTYEYWRGVPLWIDAVCGIFLFVLANLLILFQVRQRMSKQV